jgi:hypothetical protein
MNNRIGFHYFPDTEHYQDKDLSLWLPELTQMNVSWLILRGPKEYAIPESFIKGLINNKIFPIIHFDMKIGENINMHDFNIILKSYARWGVKYVVFYNTPNLRSSWSCENWSQSDLIDRFVDRYFPFANLAISLGMIPVFPPLQPGGDYWDLSFLKKYLNLLQKRKMLDLITNLHMGVSAQSFNKPVDWGAGGLSKWKQTIPYAISLNENQDHLGFRTWEWYSDIIKSITNTYPKFFLFWYGTSNLIQGNGLDSSLSLDLLISIANDSINNNPELVLKDNVISCNFWLLSETSNSNQSNLRWFKENGKPLNNSIDTLVGLKKEHQNLINKSEFKLANNVAEWVYSIDHYLLLPTYEWGVPEHVLERIRPLIRQTKPTVGFSIPEASLARKVTVWNENSIFSQEEINFLRNSGCQVDQQKISSLNNI